jgi:peptidoglycan/LPS O-acetylase OafA/YrhL
MHLLTAQDWLEKVLSSDGFVWVGKRSYSMYLIHGLILDAVQKFIVPIDTVRQIGVVIVSFGVCAMCSDLLFRFVEEPARYYGKLMLQRRHGASNEKSPKGTIKNTGAVVGDASI